jgi:two-component system sensor histidine kinase VicK
VDHFDQLKNQVRRHVFLVVLLNNVLLLEAWWANDQYLHIADTIFLPIIAVIGLVLPIVIALTSTDYVLTPLKAIWQAVLHIAPGDRQVPAPKIEDLKVGRELVSTLSAQIYQFVTQAEHPAVTGQSAGEDTTARFIMNNLPLPVLITDSAQNIVFCNEMASKYLGLAIKDAIGANLYGIVDMSFPSTNTFDSWLEAVRGKSATASDYWERVRLNVTENRPTRLFDLAAYYNQDNSAGLETMLVLFDHTEQYSQDDQAVSFMALAVHELRTPLTLLRGYIEVFEDELKDKLTPELNDFMHKMHASAEQLTTFVNNILNVARVDDDQMVLELHEETWAEVIKRSVDIMRLRAAVRDIELECTIADNLPTVGVDRVGIQEVVNNLIDNAIKYSGDSRKVSINVILNKEGLVETTIQDWGVGIPQSIVPNLFSKFYRDHRNRAQIGGTGLGLYLSKAIVTAHGGNIWVRTKEGQGSTFGFTVLPYAQLAEERKQSGNKEITRGAHGWIKNHSLYRR